MWSGLKRLGNAIYKPKERILAEKLAEGKIHIVTLQKTLIDEELNEKKLRVAILKEEMEHKKQLYELQKQEVMLRIEEYKANIDSIKKGQSNIPYSECEFEAKDTK